MPALLNIADVVTYIWCVCVYKLVIDMLFLDMEFSGNGTWEPQLSKL